MMDVRPQERLRDPATLAWVSDRVRAAPELSRSRLAEEVCARLDWRDGTGRPQTMTCRKQLLVLHRQGAIRLPPPRRPPPRRALPRPSAPPSACDPPPRITGTLSDLGRITLCPVSGASPDSRLWQAMMAAHHPLGHGRLCGAQLRYLIHSEHHGVLGGLAVSAAAWRLGARDTWLGWTDAERAANLQGIVCNSRFLILPTVQVKHLASHVLGQLTRRIGADWQQRYGIAPWLMETYIETSRPGTAYRAANWIEVGRTAGRGRQDRAGNAALEPKRVLLYPLSRRHLDRLCPNRAAPRPGWVHREFGGVELGDRRLQTRLFDVAEAFFARPQAAIPEACGSHAAAKAAYRFFDNDQVSMDALLEPHHQATIARMRQETLVLVAQDTTSLNYTLHKEMQDIGPISSKLDGPQGLLVHTALAFSAQGLPLGILDMACWARDPAEFGKRRQRNNKPIAEKESVKWLRPLQPLAAAAAQCPGSRIVVLADREADVYEYMLDAQQKRLELVVRVREKKRGLQDEIHQLWPHVLLHPVAGTVARHVPWRGLSGCCSPRFRWRAWPTRSSGCSGMHAAGASRYSTACSRAAVRSRRASLAPPTGWRPVWRSTRSWPGASTT